ncbi:4-hydroxybenzoate octaprenyltransferase [Syntrophotalea acetylenivorans]|uniref:4-hydroxybenzoate polyprenyltransferase n=1 Tax=Syntrophotalea acetylenivorans TaxID=1842532 RepID=A0A1L3GRB5_9BACT|nr:UbiA-like polyprenyltransferase [Syntrophotalea acetylenivorans]APG28482.1 4-hydroxybenzoate octaprenyltransferase [Syntrophotalea acetylenivorans]
MICSVYQKIRALLEMVRFSHTIFAFPFALMSVVLASRMAGVLPSAGQLIWICLALVGARTGAMAFNRLIDARIDAANPRTANRHLPAGRVTSLEAVLLAGGGFALLLLAAWQLNPLCLFLAPVAIGLLLFYSYCKRFTSLSHMVLGVCLAAAPVGAWVALRGSLEWSPAILGLAVLCWVAGFDIFYALQDEEFDRSRGLHSIPARLGAQRAIILARLLHGLMVLLLLFLAFIASLGGLYLGGVLLVAGLLGYEHRLVRADDLSRLNTAFFTMNGYVSVSIFVFTLIDVALTWN